MACDCVDHAITIAKLDARPCITSNLKIHGYQIKPAGPDDLADYGSDAVAIESLSETHADLARRLHDALPIYAAQVVWAAKEEMARTVADVLARRTRALFLNSAAAIAMAPEVASLLAPALGQGKEWERRQIQEFNAIAQNYSLGGK
jgi:glycerol-3-phosphate dehydrogenase